MPLFGVFWKSKMVSVVRRLWQRLEFYQTYLQMAKNVVYCY